MSNSNPGLPTPAAAVQPQAQAQPQGPLLLSIGVDRVTGAISMGTSPLGGAQDLALLANALAFAQQQVQLKLQLEQARAEGFAQGQQAAAQAAQTAGGG